jgi:hypothetical protein
VDATGQTLALWKNRNETVDRGNGYVDIYRHDASGWTLFKQLPSQLNDYYFDNFVLSGDGNTSPALDFESAKANGVSADVVAFFKPFKKGRGDTLVAFGWAMAEDLVARANGK